MPAHPVLDAAIAKLAERRPVVGILAKIVKTSLDKPDVQIKAGDDVAHATAVVIDDVMANAAQAGVAVVQVRSDWLSPTLWAQVLAFIAGIAAYFGFDIPEDVRTSIVALLGAAVTVFTFVRKMFGKPTISPAAAAKVN